MQSARRDTSRPGAAEAVLQESKARSINSSSVGIGEDFPEGSPEPQQPPQGP